ncbi:UNVERIFIED_CONTAM: hypothetical protein PYX00_000095 [Menopon gallinae]|uniref:UDP-glucuronosyltransferase n=1 Tax=Menopon gallinae TaxID=328185 RepID=A0AAW2I781_9NEOP
MKVCAGILSFAVFAASFAVVENSKILAIFPFQSKSHFVMLEALAKGLAGRGHEVTVVGHFPQKTPIPNYRDISLEGTVEQVVNNITLDFIYENWRSHLKTLDFIWRGAGVSHCEVMYKTAVFQKLVNRKEKFDLLITELWGSDCFLPLATVFDVPHISILTTMEVPWCLERYGSPINPAYSPNQYVPHSNYAMDFWMRVKNTLFTAYTRLGHYFYSERPSDAVAKKYLGRSVPDLSDLVKNSSLLFINSHFSMIGSRPFSPNVVEVGGLHISDPKPLPPDLKKILDEAKEGVIVVSFGSLIRPDSFSKEILRAFVENFKKLPHKILWKYNGAVPDQPKNVVTAKWIPQSDVLRHPNVKLFVTHGGLMGTQEAVTAGVPMLGIPFFADQQFNVINYQDKGFAIVLQLEDITEETVREALRELLGNPRYKERAMHYSKLFLDRPQSALETAIYWTEYVIRHKGAGHMKSAAADLSLLQYYLVDVLLFLLAAAVLVSALAVFVVRTIIKCVFGKKAADKKKRKKN